MKTTYFALLTIALSASLVACSGEVIEPVPAEPTEEAAESPSETQETEPAEEAAPAEALAVGDAVQFGDLKITLNSVRQYAGSAEAFDEPTNDYYLIFDVVVENTGQEIQNVSSMMNFIVNDADAYAQEQSIMVNTKGTMDGEIGVGRKIAGELAYDVTDSASYEFIFEDPFVGGQAIWTINKEDIQQ